LATGEVSRECPEARWERQLVGTVRRFVAEEKMPERCWRWNCCGCANRAGRMSALGTAALKDAGGALLWQRREFTVPGVSGVSGNRSGHSTECGETGASMAEKVMGGDVGASAQARLAFGDSIIRREQSSPLLPCAFATRGWSIAPSCTDCSRDGRVLSSGGAGANVVGGLLLKSGASSDRDEQACGGSSTAGSCRAPERARRFVEVREDLGQS
jgi:hypothetical protein